MREWIERDPRNARVIPSYVVADMMRRRAQKGRPELCLTWNGERSRATVSFVRSANAGSPKATLSEIVRNTAAAIRSIIGRILYAHPRPTKRAR